MRMIVLRLLPLRGLDRGVFPEEGESVDSWTPGPKPLCHRHPTGPHPSGLLWTPWTPAKGATSRSCASARIDDDGAFPYTGRGPRSPNGVQLFCKGEDMMKPNARPARPDFSSGPCAKRPGWTPEALKDAAVGRSHRSKLGKKKIVEAVDRTRSMLGIPADYRIAIVPASDTGAVEMALWSLLGARPVDMLAWESFGEGWVTDVAKQLKLKDARVLKAPYGQIADLRQVDWTHDVVFTWNGTTSGVKVPNGDWIAADREGLAICDATSAVFAMDLPWQKLA